MNDFTPHKPVLLKEILAMVQGLREPPVWGLDVTFGRGGHARAFLDTFPRLRLIGLDQDEEAISYGEATYGEWISSGRLSLAHGSFHDGEKVRELQGRTEGHGFDFILMDLGVSSPQLDTPERGFSFYHEGPLDMRMDQRQHLTAADIVNNWPDRDLIRLFREYGEIRRPERVVQRVTEHRRKQKFTTTTQLSTLIEKAEGWHKKGFHPATRFFLALRLEVNRELDGLEPSLTPLIESLAFGGRLIVITFHSLEDRIIKYALKERAALGRPVNKKVIVPSREECLDNPRARSAKLRVFQRGVTA